MKGKEHIEDMKNTNQSVCGSSSYDEGISTQGSFTNSVNDDVLIMKTIREITSRGNNAEVRQRSNGKLAVYEVKKRISIG